MTPPAIMFVAWNTIWLAGWVRMSPTRMLAAPPRSVPGAGLARPLTVTFTARTTRASGLMTSSGAGPA